MITKLYSITKYIHMYVDFVRCNVCLDQLPTKLISIKFKYSYISISLILILFKVMYI